MWDRASSRIKASDSEIKLLKVFMAIQSPMVDMLRVSAIQVGHGHCDSGLASCNHVTCKLSNGQRTISCSTSREPSRYNRRPRYYFQCRAGEGAPGDDMHSSSIPSEVRTDRLAGSPGNHMLSWPWCKLAAYIIHMIS